MTWDSVICNAMPAQSRAAAACDQSPHPGAVLCLSGPQSNAVAASALRENGRVTVDIPVRVQSCQSTISAFVMNADGDIVHVRRLRA